MHSMSFLLLWACQSKQQKKDISRVGELMFFFTTSVITRGALIDLQVRIASVRLTTMLRTTATVFYNMEYG